MLNPKLNIMKTLKNIIVLGALTIAVAFQANAQQEQNNEDMKTYLIEREIPEAGKLTQEELKGISQKS